MVLLLQDAGKCRVIRKPRRDECPPTPLALSNAPLHCTPRRALEAAKQSDSAERVCMSHLPRPAKCHCQVSASMLAARSYFLTMALSSLEGNMITTRAMASARLRQCGLLLDSTGTSESLMTRAAESLPGVAYV